jgi:parallel beta-helix repeat protein
MSISSTGYILEKQSTIATSGGNTLYVGGSGPNNYTKIQDAINDSLDGDTVFVYDDSSPYYENLNVSKSINLRGEDEITTIIDGNISNTSYFCITIFADNVTLSGFTIQNDNEFIGIGLMVISDNNVISDNIISNNGGTGLYIIGFKNNISHNIVSNNGYGGILCDYSKHAIIGNEISNNYIGISLWFGSPSLISHNNISENKVGIEVMWATNNSIIPLKKKYLGW